ncbi:sigma-70 family RNA polymerase sigma factor [Cryptosporangium phraense]|uniref:Sigma-70 family RNA polymerase sigma factor n=1 Tax=Cryptosporangium phraense TaxID=2593070 RepID=A0A545APR2_9ACTN|nr:sigma-70 family RNA polymerase sigma factor [Cryptosporangium phraense]TQS43318.1 sigma-70 family RNA polymerase sigma factor [Cryptosporangium phraense]
MLRATAGEGPDYSEYAQVEPLFRRYAELGSGPERSELRERLILLHLPLAEHVGRRFARRGEPLDDLVQVASLELVRLIDRFDPDRGTAFLSFAVPSMTGAIQHHFRDVTWSVRPPRRLRRLHQDITVAMTDLYRSGRQSPTTRTLARHLGVPVGTVAEGLLITSARAPASLDAPPRGEGGRRPLGETLGEADRGHQLVEQMLSLEAALADLPERDRRILGLRYVHELTQSQIAADVGVSQMQISRLLAKILARLRHRLLFDD